MNKEIKADAHTWVKRMLGKNPPKCEICGVVGCHKNKTWSIHWSNRDHKYKKRKVSWRGLCAWCHTHYDGYLRAWILYYDKPREWHEKYRRILPERQSPSLDKQRKWIRSVRRGRSVGKI